MPDPVLGATTLLEVDLGQEAEAGPEGQGRRHQNQPAKFIRRISPYNPVYIW